MVSAGCEREHEVQKAIAAGLWNERCDEELHAHAAACAACREIAAVTAALLDDRLAAMQAAPVPRPGLVWWRMQLRARREARAGAARTVSRVHATVLACAFGVAAVILGATWLVAAGGAASGQARALAAVALQASWGLPLLVAVAAWLVLGPVAVWLAVSED